VLGVLAAAAALAAALVQAAPAQAALSGTDWTAQTLPANYFIGGGGPPLSPVSCVPRTQFCLVIANDSAVLVNGFFIGQAALVSTDAGKSWTGHASLPSTFRVTAVSCVSNSVCWASGPGWRDQPSVAKTTDGGQTWTDMTPAAWASATWWPNSIDCVSATTCWLAGEGNQSLQVPAVAKTTDGGATWTTFTNLPTFTSSDPNGTYLLNGISCVSPRSCVAAGGLNESDGTATVISTTNGGATWSRSMDPALSGVQQLFSVSCLRADDGTPTCAAAADALQAAGPVTLVSHDGGATWGGMQTFDNTGSLNSISCVNTRHCWAAGAGTSVALVGTSNGGTSWSSVTSDTTNQDGSVSCLSVKVCVATTDNGLWVTSDNGGLPWY
jgi:photosystem II stability/assembly factor-like uncharacterized protein